MSKIKSWLFKTMNEINKPPKRLCICMCACVSVCMSLKKEGENVRECVYESVCVRGSERVREDG